MTRPKICPESLFFLLASGLFALVSLLLFIVRTRLHLSNPRVAYGVHHLPAAFLGVTCFLLGLAALWAFRSFQVSPEGKSSAWFLMLVAALFCIFWLPVWLAGGFVQDDWMLLCAASIRTVVAHHPALGWLSLDSVDGNFRPLGTVLYPSIALRLGGIHPLAFLAANFLVNLGSTLVLFSIVRLLRYSKVVASVAAILYLSRDVLYNANAWFSALGDALAILLCGLAVLATLRALRSRTGAAIAFHVLAFGCFVSAMLSKQSAFAAAIIIPLVFFLRPGEDEDVPLPRRLGTGLTALLVYGLSAVFVFEHAKRLLGARTPYSLHFGLSGVEALFEYLFWYFADLSAPNAGRVLLFLPVFAGVLVTIGLVVLTKHLRWRWRIQPVPVRYKDLWFTLAASAASLAIVLPLAPRVAAYYSSMFAFWFSILLVLCLASAGLLDFSAVGMSACRRTAFALCLLIAFSFTDVRVMQTGMIPSGGYIWGTFGMDQNASAYRQISSRLGASPGTRTLILVDFPAPVRQYACMALLSDEGLTRIVAYDSKAKSFSVNDRNGLRPADDLDALRDPEAYNWSVVLPAAQAEQLLANDADLWLTMHGNTITTSSPSELIAPSSR